MTESPNKHKRNESTPIKDSIKDRSINNKKDESIFEVHDEREKSINVGRDRITSILVTYQEALLNMIIISMKILS